jgi:hypothetical protein
MKVLENGDYLLDDGRVIPADQIAKQGKTAPRSARATEAQAKEDALELQEGQSSGTIRLED